MSGARCFPSAIVLPLSTLRGLHLDILQSDWWVPGNGARSEISRFAGKPQWKEILQATNQTCMLWATRATQDLTILFISDLWYNLNLL